MFCLEMNPDCAIERQNPNCLRTEQMQQQKLCTLLVQTITKFEIQLFPDATAIYFRY